jgi:hypothetical protein
VAFIRHGQIGQQGDILAWLEFEWFTIEFEAGLAEQT